jgi:hypothetical protein
MNNGSEPPKRHWHGTVGDRYEQLNVWVRGGAIQTLPGRRPSTDVNDRHVRLTSFLETTVQTIPLVINFDFVSSRANNSTGLNIIRVVHQFCPWSKPSTQWKRGAETVKHRSL